MNIRTLATLGNWKPIYHFKNGELFLMSSNDSLTLEKSKDPYKVDCYDVITHGEYNHALFQNIHWNRLKDYWGKSC